MRHHALSDEIKSLLIYVNFIITFTQFTDTYFDTEFRLWLGQIYWMLIFLWFIFICTSDCAKGYFRNLTNNECKPCTIGTYSDLTNATSCSDCSPGYTTSQEGSNQSAQCTGRENVLNYAIKMKKIMVRWMCLFRSGYFSYIRLYFFFRLC